MCPIVDGQPVNAAVTNNEKLDRQSDDTAFGIISLDNSETESGATIENAQRAINRTMTAAGVNETTEDGMSYSPVPADTITDGDSHELALRKLSNLFQGITGHNHDGTDGNGPTLFTPPATTGANGGVTLPSSDPLDVSGVAYLGSSGSTTVAFADHQHKGVRSLSISGDSELFGDIVFKPGLNIDLSQASGNPNEIEIIGNITSVSGADIDGSTASNTSRITIPKDTKANLDALTRKEGTVVYATDTDKLYYDDGTILKPVGSGSGGGINFITLTSTLSPDISDNSDAESSLGLWTGFDNGAVSVPTDMNTPATLTDLVLSRTNTSGEVLNGDWSFKVVKAATDTQGQGHSVPGFIPAGYTGKRQRGWLLYRHLAGAWVQGDIKWFVQWYDSGTSSWKNCEVSNNDMFGSGGIVEFYIDVPYSADPIPVRFGYMVCTTTTAGATFSFDDLKFDDLDLAASSVVMKPKKYTPVFGGCSPTSIDVTYTIDGNNMIITGSAVMGSAAGSAFTMSLPDGYAPDGPIGGYSFAGRITRGNTGDPSARSLIYTGDDALLRMGQTASPLSPTTANVMGNGEAFFFGPLVIPLKNISNATLTQTSTFYLSQILATGTRVTTTPTKLGEYRTQSWQNGGFSLADVSTGTISVSDGMSIYTRDGTSGVTAGPNRWEFYIGTGKSYSFNAFAAANKTVPLDTGVFTYASSTDQGLIKEYSPTTGVLTVTAFYYGSLFSRFIDVSANVKNGYFDILVSETAQPMAVVAPNIEFYVDTGNGYGSTNNKIRRYSNVRKNVGNGYSESAAGGAVFTAPEDGIYQFTLVDRRDGGQGVIGISVNSSALTTSIESIDYSQGYRGCIYASSVILSSYTSPAMRLKKGDEVRPHTDGNLTLSDSRVLFSGWQVSK